MDFFRNVKAVQDWTSARGVSPAFDYLAYITPAFVGMLLKFGLGHWAWFVGGVFMSALVVYWSLTNMSKLGYILRTQGEEAFEEATNKFFGFKKD